MDCSSPGSSAHGISQARILEWVAICSSRGSSWARGRTCVSCIGRWILYHWATREAQWIACLPSKYHSWTCNLLSEAVFTWNINSFIKHFEDPAKITNDLSVSTFFFPEKCKAIGNSTSSLTTVCSLHFIQWEWFYGTAFKTRIFKPLENFQILWVLSRKGVRDWIICVSASVLFHPHFGVSASNTLSVVSSLVLYSSWHLEYTGDEDRSKVSSTHTRWTVFEVVCKRTFCISENIKTLGRSFSLGIVE